jgi:hypothetical protein
MINKGQSSGGEEDQYSPAPDAKTRKGKRGTAYTMKEDELLCLAWLNTSIDPIAGAEQSGSTFWKKVHEFFHEMKNYTSYELASDRSESSLNHRWYAIQESVNKYCGAYAQNKNRAPSGVGVIDYVSFASYKVHHMLYLP